MLCWTAIEKAFSKLVTPHEAHGNVWQLHRKLSFQAESSYIFAHVNYTCLLETTIK